MSGKDLSIVRILKKPETYVKIKNPEDYNYMIVRAEYFRGYNYKVNHFDYKKKELRPSNLPRGNSWVTASPLETLSTYPHVIYFVRLLLHDPLRATTPFPTNDILRRLQRCTNF